MKNITLSADQHKTLNTLFREWLQQLADQDGGGQDLDSLMKRLKHVQVPTASQSTR